LIDAVARRGAACLTWRDHHVDAGQYAPDKTAHLGPATWVHRPPSYAEPLIDAVEGAVDAVEGAVDAVEGAANG
jgi:hypothetical protein